MHMDKKYDLDAIVRGCISLGVIVLLYLLAQRLSGVLVPFLASWFVAYLISPMVDFFQYKCRMKYRGLAVAAALLVVLLGLAVFALMIIPSMSREMVALSGYISEYIANFDASDYLPEHLTEHYRNLITNLDVAVLLEDERVMSAIKSGAPHVWHLLSNGVSALAGLAVAMICVLYIVFILLDWDQLSTGAVDLIPHKYRPQAKMLLDDLSVGMNAYFRNQGKIAAIVGLLFAVGFEIIGLPMGIAMGLLIGVLNMVPYMQTLAIPPCLLLGVLQSAETGRPLWLVLLLLFVVFIVVQSLQDLVLTPKIMGKAMGLHPAIILLALSIWGSLLGIAGMIIALPITTLMISYYKRFVIRG